MSCTRSKCKFLSLCDVPINLTDCSDLHWIQSLSPPPTSFKSSNLIGSVEQELKSSNWILVSILTSLRVWHFQYSFHSSNVVTSASTRLSIPFISNLDTCDRVRISLVELKFVKLSPNIGSVFVWVNDWKISTRIFFLLRTSVNFFTVELSPPYFVIFSLVLEELIEKVFSDQLMGKELNPTYSWRLSASKLFLWHFGCIKEYFEYFLPN